MINLLGAEKYVIINCFGMFFDYFWACFDGIKFLFDWKLNPHC